MRGPAILQWNISSITVAGFESEENMSNALHSPCGFTWDPSETLYIAEEGTSSSTKWVPDSPNRIVIACMANGTWCNTPNVFSHSIDVFVGANDDMNITDNMNQRLQY